MLRSLHCRLLIHSLGSAHLLRLPPPHPPPPPPPPSPLPPPLPSLPLSLSLREIAAYSRRLVCSRPTAIASLAIPLAAHTTASTIPPLSPSLSFSLARSLARSLALAATRDQRQEALSVEEGTTFVRSVRPFKSHGRTERDSLAPSVRPTVPHFLRPPGMKRQKNNNK